MNRHYKTALVLLVLFFASFFLRIWTADFAAPLSGDEPDYHLLAKNIAEGKGFVKEVGNPTAWRTPAFPAILAVIYTFNESTVFAKLVLIFLVSFSTIIIYFLSYSLLGKTAPAIISAIIWTILPTSLILSGGLLAECISVLLLALAFLITKLCLNKTQRLAFLGIAISGLLIGSAVLARGYLIFVILALPCYLIFSQNRKKLGLICLFFSVLLPFAWIVRNYLTLDSITLSTETAQVVWHGNNRWSRGGWNAEWFLPESEQKAFLIKKYPQFEQLSESERAKIFKTEAIQEILSDPLRIVLLSPKKILIFLSPNSYLGFDWVYFFCIPLALAGLVLIFKDESKRGFLWLLFFPVSCVAVVCVITFGDSRFRHPVDFCFVILASHSLVWINDKLKRKIANKSSIYGFFLSTVR